MLFLLIAGLTELDAAVHATTKTGECPKIEAFAYAEPEASIWRFLTQPDARTALDPKAPREKREAALAKLPKVLGVITFDTRAWPERVGKKSGAFSGAITFVDLASASALCKKPLVFANTKPVHFTKAHDVEDILTDDLEVNFDAAIAAIRKDVAKN